MIQLDTNFLVTGINPDSELNERLSIWMAEGIELATSAMAWSEYQCGPPTGLPSEEEEIARSLISKIIPVDESIAELAARLFNATGRRSRRLADCLIAATAILSDAPLATANADDFHPFLEHGLRLAD